MKKKVIIISVISVLIIIGFLVFIISKTNNEKKNADDVNNDSRNDNLVESNSKYICYKELKEYKNMTRANKIILEFDNNNSISNVLSYEIYHITSVDMYEKTVDNFYKCTDTYDSDSNITCLNDIKELKENLLKTPANQYKDYLIKEGYNCEIEK